MKFISIVIFIILAISVEAKQKTEPKIDIHFVMERNGKNVGDIKQRAMSRVYGKKHTFSGFTRGSFDGQFVQRYIQFEPKNQGGQRSMVITVCEKKKSFAYGIKKEESCELYEKIEFQFQPNQVVVLPSKVEHDSKYEIVVKEHRVKPKS